MSAAAERHAVSVTQESAGKQLYFFIRRPVLAAVISIVIVLLGTFALIGCCRSRATRRSRRRRCR